ncbi:MAG: biotin transporter BioY [Candidatus Methanomethylicaceae archaeon]
MLSPRIIAISAIFAAFTTIGAWITIPTFYVPFTLQTLFVYLSVLILRKYAFLSQGIYILLGLIGLPVFAMGKPGYLALIGPTGGYIIGFFFGSFAGFLKRDVISVFVCMTTIFFLGWLWLSYWIGFYQAFFIGVIPFIPWDILKAVLALLIFKKIF